MTATSTAMAMEQAGAPPRLALSWPQHWEQIEAHVKRLQVRIAKATRDSRWGKVQALQHLLTRSYFGKLLAVKRVTENQGRRTPGVDGKLWSTSAARLMGAQTLRHRGYRPLPLRRIYIPKSNGKKRPLGIPTIRDRAMQGLWKLALEPVAEMLADPHSYGFRPGRSTADAIEQCFNVLSRRNSAQWVLEGDIRGCFDHINHDWLLANVPMDKGVLRQWLQAGYMDQGALHATQAGTPQGGVISPVLANWTLDGLEEAVRASLAPTLRKRQALKVHVVRYADDFIVTGATHAVLQDQVRPAIEAFLKERGLTLAEEKTHITPITQGFDFLGQNIRKYANKLLITPSRKSVKALMDKVRELIHANRTATQADLIHLLNPRIRGWAMYHRHIVAADCFGWIDHKIWYGLWRWAVRRHATKSARWIKQRYFHIAGQRDWVFAAQAEQGGNDLPVWLFAASSVSITRHIKVCSAATPFDPAWSSYFERRRSIRQVTRSKWGCWEA